MPWPDILQHHIGVAIECFDTGQDLPVVAAIDQHLKQLFHGFPWLHLYRCGCATSPNNESNSKSGLRIVLHALLQDRPQLQAVEVDQRWRNFRASFDWLDRSARLDSIISIALKKKVLRGARIPDRDFMRFH